jgi:hypothetical protein
VPDYDGRGNAEADAGSWVLWIPRIALSPLYLANEYVLRRPLGAVVTHAERARWADSVAHLFTFGEGDRSSIVPIASFDLGQLPSAGLAYERRDAFVDGNALELRAATWGPRWIDASIADRYAIDEPDRVAARVAVHRTEDNLFVGLGPDATRATRSRFGLARIAGGAGYRRQLGGGDWAGSWLDAEAGVRRVDFVRGDCCGDPSLDTRIARGEVMAPPGYGDDYTAAYGRIELTLDARRPRPDPGSGGYVHLQAAPSATPGAVADRRAWIAYGAVAGAALDLTGHRRTLELLVAVDAVDALAGGALPFTEYAELDGDVMAGFPPGWLAGRSTAAAQLGYTWPLWIDCDAHARVAVGNAFGAHLAGLAADKLRVSGDIGLTTSSERDSGFEVLIGLGTETFEQGAGATSLRVMLGSKRGF